MGETVTQPPNVIRPADANELPAVTPSQLIDQIPALIAYWDKDLICRVANRSYTSWFGVTPGELVGQSIRELLGPKLFALNEPYIGGALRGETQTFERMVPGPDGVQRHSLARYIPDLVDGEVKGFVAYVTEVTQLKVTQAELEQSVQTLRLEVERRQSAEDKVIDLRQELSTVLEGIGAGFVAANRQGRITRINRVFERLFGYSELEAIGQPLWEVFRREGRASEATAASPVDVMIRDGVTIDVSHEVTGIARNGRRLPLQVNAGLTHGPDSEVRGMAVIVRDKSELRDAENERRHAEALLSNVVDASPNALLIVDADRVIRFANATVERLFG